LLFKDYLAIFVSMRVTLDIKEAKAEAFLNFIKSLDFVSVKEEASGFVLSDEHKKILDSRKEAHTLGESKSFSWGEVKKNARKANEKA